MGGHKVDRRGIGEFSRDDKIPFVLAILMIHKNVNAALTSLFNDLFDGLIASRRLCSTGPGFSKDIAVSAWLRLR